MKNGKFIIIFLLICMACAKKDIDTESSGEELVRSFLYNFRLGESTNKRGGQKLSKDLYNAVYSRRTEWVKQILTNGVDPNYCRGESGWADSNPLNVVSESFYNTYYLRQSGKQIPDPALDLVVFQLLTEAGAEINMRPYIWNRVYLYNNQDIDSIKRQRKFANESLEPVIVQEQFDCFVADANRLLEAFLIAGADPDKLGHPYPYSEEAMYAGIDDRQANEYFAQGTRAINEAIKKGIIWESQVDLLLQYTKLDEDSLIAAEESGDRAMIEKINRLWEIQQIQSN